MNQLIKMFGLRKLIYKSTFKLSIYLLILSIFNSSLALKDKKQIKKDGYLTQYACEGNTVHIKCKEPNTVINIIRANYGRYSIATCNDQGALHYKVDCTSHKTLYVIQNRCNNKQECIIEASSNIFEDACPSTPKYLEAQYRCISYSDNIGNLTSTSGNNLNNPFGFGQSIDLKNKNPNLHIPIRQSNSSHLSKIPGNPFGTVRTNQHQFTTTTTTALPKIIVPNLPIHFNSPTFVTQSTTIATTTTTANTSSSKLNNLDDDTVNKLNSKTTTPIVLNNPNKDHLSNDLFIHNNSHIQNGNYNKIHNDIQNNNLNDQTPASSSPFIKTEQNKQSSTESTLNQQSNEQTSDRNPSIRRSMLNSQNTGLSIFLTISIILAIGIECLTLIIFIFTRSSSKRIVNYMNISLILICLETILLIATNRKSINYSTIFSSQFIESQKQNQLNLISLPSLLSILFYYLLQVLFNLFLIESIRIYCNYLLKKRNLKSRGFIYFTNTDQQTDSNLLKCIRWSRSKYLPYSLAYLLPLLSCSLILFFIDNSIKFFITSLLLIDAPFLINQHNALSIVPNITQSPEDHYPQLGLLILCFAFTYFVLFLAILLIFIAAKGFYHLQQNFNLNKLNDLSNKFGSTSSYSNSLTANYNQLTLNSLKQNVNGTSGPQIPQLNTLAAINNIDNSLCSGQLDLMINNYTKRATMKLLIIILIGQTFCWSIWLSICHLNSRLNVNLDYHQFNELEQQDHSSISSILQILIAVFACLNIAQSIFVLASAFHKNHKINSLDSSTEHNLFNSKLRFGLNWLPICVRKNGASPLPLIAGGNQLSGSSVLNSASSSIQQSQLMIPPNNQQQSVYFYSLDPNQLNNQIGNQLNNQSAVINKPPSPIIKLNNSNILNHHHTLMMNRNTNNYLNREINTMYRQTKHNDYLLANTTTNRIANNNTNNGIKSQHNLVPYLLQQRPQSYSNSSAITNQRFSVPDVNPYAPPVLIDENHHLNEQLINNNNLLNNDDQADYEEVLPNFNYLNTNIIQPGQSNLILNTSNSTTLRNKANTLHLINSNSKLNTTNNDSFNNNLQLLNNYNNQLNSQNNQQQQQFEIEQDIYESVESPCIYTRSPIYYTEGNRG